MFLSFPRFHEDLPQQRRPCYISCPVTRHMFGKALMNPLFYRKRLCSTVSINGGFQPGRNDQPVVFVKNSQKRIFWWNIEIFAHVLRFTTYIPYGRCSRRCYWNTLYDMYFILSEVLFWRARYFLYLTSQNYAIDKNGTIPSSTSHSNH